MQLLYSLYACDFIKSDTETYFLTRQQNQVIAALQYVLTRSQNGAQQPANQTSWNVKVGLLAYTTGFVYVHLLCNTKPAEVNTTYY